MPYGLRRRYGRRPLRSRGLKRRRVGRKTRSTYRIARKALTGVRKINKAIELKYVDYNLSSNYFPGRQVTDRFILPFNDPASQGPHNTQMIGSKAMLKYLHIRGTIQLINNRFLPPTGLVPPVWNNNADNLGNYFQPVKIWVAIVPTNIAGDPSEIATKLNQMWKYNDQNYVNMTSFKIWDHQREVKLIYQKTYILSTISRPYVLVSLKIPIRKLTSWNISDSQKALTNALVCGVISDTSTTYSQARCDLNTRVTFTDS